MQSFFKSGLLRSISGLTLGGLLVAFSADMPQWLVMACGALFVLPALVSIIAYWRTPKAQRGSGFMPVVGIGSTLFGTILLIFPALFVTVLMYILASILLIVGAAQTLSLWQMRSDGFNIHAATFLVPILTFCAGLLVVIQPELVAALPFVILGSAFIVNSLLELFTTFLRHRRNSRAVRPIQEIESAQ